MKGIDLLEIMEVKKDKTYVDETKELTKIPLTYFYQDEAIINRILMKVFARFAQQDIERKHINFKGKKLTPYLIDVEEEE